MSMNMASINERASVVFEISEKTKIIMENPNETSRGSTSSPVVTVDERERSTVGRHPQWLLPLLHELNTHHPERKREHIHKIPPFLSGIEQHKGCFEPMLVSIGPYHHGKKELQEMEKLKVSIAKDFLGEDLENLNWFEEVAGNARSCYDMENGDCDSDKFTRMMLMDGCFVLYIIRSCVMVDDKPEDTKLKTHQLVFVLSDLLLLENQLPFLILKALMKFKGSVSDWEDPIKSFLKGQLHMEDNPPSCYLTSFKIDDRHLHLLHILHQVLTADAGEEIKPRSSNGGHHSFRSVVELADGGIKFEKSEGRSLKDVRLDIHWNHAKVFLPQLVIDDLTRSRLLNLVAYEACSTDGPNDDPIVTSYICFLDALIDHTEDVQKLRKKRILVNQLGSDQEVADLFNQLSQRLVPIPSKYTTVMDNIEHCYQKRSFIWSRELWITHFKSPWTAIASILALIIIILTFAQAYFAVFPRGGGGDEGGRKAPKPSRKFHYS